MKYHETIFDSKAHLLSAISSIILLLSLTFVTGCASLCKMETPDKGAKHWVGTWSTSVEPIADNTKPPNPPGLSDTTIRQIVHVSIGGQKIRVRFANTFSEHWVQGLKINSAAIAVSAGADRIKPETSRMLTFDGQPGVTVAPGALVISDPVDFDLQPLSDLAITMHVTDSTNRLSGHRGARCTVYLKAGEEVMSAELPEAAKATSWYFLGGVDVWADNDAAAVAAIGDSITDGRGTTTDGNGRWTDFLARRLQANPQTGNIGVMNHGIGGNALLRGGLSNPVVARLDRDILAQPGVRWLIVLCGINDLNGKQSSAEDLISAFEQVILRSHDRNIRVYGATILPCGGSHYISEEREADRKKINDWIRTSGAFDAVIDFDAALRNPQNPDRLLPEAADGDHLHLNDHGYSMMADAVNLELFADH